MKTKIYGSSSLLDFGGSAAVIFPKEEFSKGSKLKFPDFFLEEFSRKEIFQIISHQKFQMHFQ